ncbi:hypothetical protein BO94DRAFT_579143 [Aspergillus sclerotioniger CBS 115572]|uniref:Uncharacterized protein n=1 Tax=Aspergillus sclerotioniger CBS 115572 TaxID=1450535 RepID=A0A317VCP2_9EURO|nr:hypothetical protein BO94DRAFT_579143 [Aspergillus sclerotioniger CBS 115572]PWY69650.1 hypothetical protein BO94DRAFT_579143 [Aspergillus sclerotioniger CBS 115572]
MEDMLRRIVSYVWDHPKVQLASTADKKQLLVDLRLFFLSHLDQLDDNEQLQKDRTCTQPHASYLTLSAKPRHSSLFNWIQMTSGHHTGGAAALSFLLCLAAAGNNALPSPRARYIGEKLSQSLRGLARIQNDYGSIDRDQQECNLNSIDFLDCPFREDGPDEAPRKRRRTESTGVVGSSSPRSDLLDLAQHERQSIDRLLQEDLPKLLDPRVLGAMRTFTAGVEMYGQMYILRDHTPRNTEKV